MVKKVNVSEHAHWVQEKIIKVARGRWGTSCGAY